MPSLAMATRMRLMAFSVTCKSGCGPFGWAGFGGAACVFCGGRDPMVTTLDIIAFLLRNCSGSRSYLACAVLFLPVANGGANGVLGQHRTVNLDRRQGEFLHNICVLDGQRVVHGAALDPLGGQR